ncbi:MAG: mechanosensitive ion channel family protein, partial [Rhodospirillales bacterium]|nr:mechanosensitive ion channel family protein [Rhodospirillales bacterium]
AVPNAAMWARSVSNFSRSRPRCVEIDIAVERGTPFGELRVLIDDTLKAEALVFPGFGPLIKIVDVKIKSMTIRAAFWCDAEHVQGARKRVSDELRATLTAAGAVVKRIAPARKTPAKKKPIKSETPPQNDEVG